MCLDIHLVETAQKEITTEVFKCIKQKEGESRKMKEERSKIKQTQKQKDKR